jgi:DNA-binding beta-propeller fold protein YncE
VQSPDGIAIDSTGTNLYVASKGTTGTSPGSIVRINIATGTQTGSCGPFGVGPDGIAIGLGSLNGCVYVNDNGGTLWEVCFPTTTGGACQINACATGGTRGDFIAVDPNVKSGSGTTRFASLLASQADGYVRFDPPAGGWFGTPTSTTDPIFAPAPTPAIPVLGIGALGVLVAASGSRTLRRNRRRNG